MTMIPEAAVGAAQRAIDPDFDATPKHYKSYFLMRMRAALEAAAPHMLAQAWDEGYTTGNAHNGRRDANPYRTAK